MSTKWRKHPVASSKTKRRMTDPYWWDDEHIGELNYFERCFLHGLVGHADDQGRLYGNPAVLRSLLFKFDNVTVEDAEAALASIEREGFIVQYTVDGKNYVQIVDWWNDGAVLQKPQWAYPSEYPPPDGWNERLRYRFGNDVVTLNWRDDDPSGFDDGDLSPEDDTPPTPFLGIPLGKETAINSPNGQADPPIESESESVTESDSDSGLMGGDPPVRLLAREWEAQFGAGSITQTVGMQFDDWLAEFGLTETLAAIRATGDRSKRERVRWPAKYVDAVLKKGDAVHPAVKVWLEEARRPRPGASLEADIIKTVGETDASLELWRQVMHAYCGLGWNREAVLNQLDFFNHREVPARQPKERTFNRDEYTAPPPPRLTPEQQAEARRLAAEQPAGNTARDAIATLTRKKSTTSTYASAAGETG